MILLKLMIETCNKWSEGHPLLTLCDLNIIVMHREIKYQENNNLS